MVDFLTKKLRLLRLQRKLDTQLGLLVINFVNTILKKCYAMMFYPHIAACFHMHTMVYCGQKIRVFAFFLQIKQIVQNNYHKWENANREIMIKAYVVKFMWMTQVRPTLRLVKGQILYLPSLGGNDSPRDSPALVGCLSACAFSL